MTKLILYLQCGLGDWYDLLAMLPAILKEKNLKKEDIKIYIDCIYFHDNTFINERFTAEELLNRYSDDWIIVPKECGSYKNIYFPDGVDRQKGIIYENIKNDFLFYRLSETKEYMKDKINDNDIFISAVMGKEIYEWKNGENILLDLERKPLESANNSPKILLIHVRKKGIFINETFYKKFIEYCTGNNIRCILIGNLEEINLDISNRLIIDLRSKLTISELFYYIRTIDYMFGSSSMFTYHRFHSNKPTIIATPDSTGAGPAEIVMRKEYLENKNYLFVNADSDCYNKIKEQVDEWLN